MEDQKGRGHHSEAGCEPAASFTPLAPFIRTAKSTNRARAVLSLPKPVPTHTAQQEAFERGLRVSSILTSEQLVTEDPWWLEWAFAKLVSPQLVWGLVSTGLDIKVWDNLGRDQSTDYYVTQASASCTFFHWEGDSLHLSHLSHHPSNLFLWLLSAAFHTLHCFTAAHHALTSPGWI